MQRQNKTQAAKPCMGGLFLAICSPATGQLNQHRAGDKKVIDAWIAGRARNDNITYRAARSTVLSRRARRKPLTAGDGSFFLRVMMPRLAMAIGS